MAEGKLSRREMFRWGAGAGFALAASGLWLPACKGGQGRKDAAVPKATATPSDEALNRYGPYGAREAEAIEAQRTAEAKGETCAETEFNIEGPYYRKGAPFRSDLGKGFEGTVLTVRGVVRGADCAPVSGAVLDFWHADHKGRYDNDGSHDVAANVYELRGKVKTNERGEYEVKTIVPGRYLNGRQYRPSHIHVKVSAAGHSLLTTQLYFPGDPYNDVDPFILPSLIMDVKESNGEQLATFDFAIA